MKYFWPGIIQSSRQKNMLEELKEKNKNKTIFTPDSNTWGKYLSEHITNRLTVEDAKIESFFHQMNCGEKMNSEEKMKVHVRRKKNNTRWKSGVQ